MADRVVSAGDLPLAEFDVVVRGCMQPTGNDQVV